MSVNIGNSIDPFYRYKRPMISIENRNGKTIITNLENVAKALETKSSYILYFIQLEKSASVTTRKEIKMVLSKNEIETLLNKFIEEYILCSTCRYPELNIVKEKKKLYHVCRACGNHRKIIENKFTKIIYKDYFK